MKRLLGFFLALGVLATLGKSSAGTKQPNTVRASFEMAVGGKKAGVNSYRLTPNSTGFSLESRTEVHSIFDLTFFEQTQLDSHFYPISYHLTIVLPFGAQEVLAHCTTDSIFLKYRRNLQNPFKKKVLKKKVPLFLLDNNMLDHWDILFHAFSAPDSLSAFALIPQVLRLTPLKIHPMGTDTLHTSDGVRAVQKFELSYAELSVTIWVDPTTRNLQKLSIPAQKFSMRRLPSFVDFSLSERDSLLKKYTCPRSQNASSHLTEKEVTFRSDSLLLAGTITFPPDQDNRKFPAVLFISGSGDVDRNENNQAIHINLFPQLVDTLTPNGFATFRYDKRGVGKSQGVLEEADLNDLVLDAGHALDFLKRQPHIDSTRVAIVGHSEGAILGLILASQRPDVRGLVLMAGTARNLGNVVLDQLAYLQKLKGASSATVAATLNEQRAFFQKVKEGKLPPITRRGNTAWWREHLAFEPLNTVCKIKAPLLILNGAKDYQVSAQKDAQPLFRKAQSCGLDVTLKIYPNLDHLFEPVKGKSTPELYFKPGRHVPAQVKADVLNWLKKKLQ